MEKTVLITGASRGIGAGIATAFAREGYHLILTCHRQESLLLELKSDLAQTYHISCDTFTGDLSDPSEIDRLFSQISSLDVLVNNVGISYIGLFTDMSIAHWHRIMDTNLTSAFLCSQHALSYMLPQKSGKIINITSAWGSVGASMEVAYSASKAGLNGLTKALAKELAPSNIQVNAIACGVMDTDMNHCFSREEMDSLIEEIPADRLGTPLEVGELAVQLATGNTYLTGQIIGLDGGWI
ncbi:MAG: SDR family NAD(P)-dependent oxidoreductase [Lachnospiraceae bacterium]|nr:SDR family NAD(P)-dependent oxidoreductase [Lachnospiraceae bacterium]